MPDLGEGQDSDSLICCTGCCTPGACQSPREALAERRRHWPDGIEATVKGGRPFDNWPRLPFQISASLPRTVPFLS